MEKSEHAEVSSEEEEKRATVADEEHAPADTKDSLRHADMAMLARAKDALFAILEAKPELHAEVAHWQSAVAEQEQLLNLEKELFDEVDACQAMSRVLDKSRFAACWLDYCTRLKKCIHYKPYDRLTGLDSDCEFRIVTRSRFAEEHSWGVLSRNLVAAVAEHIAPGLVLGIFSGNAAFESALAFDVVGPVVATDIKPTTAMVEELEAVEAVRHYVNDDAPCTLVVSWPPYACAQAAHALREFAMRAKRGSKVVYWGEWRGCCASDDFFDGLEAAHFELRVELEPRRWKSIWDCVWVYELTGEAAAEPAADPDAVDAVLAEPRNVE